MVRCPHRLVTFVAAFLLVLCTLGVQGVAPGVSPASASAAAAAADAQEEQARFDAWLDQLFRNEIVRDTIMLHAVLVRPAELGIADNPLLPPAPLSAGDVQRDREETQAQLDELRGFETSLLTDDQQLVYALIEETAEWGLGLQEMDLLTQYARPSDGLHVTNAIMLSEYEFASERDIVDYLVLLGQLRPCFEAVVAHARE